MFPKISLPQKVLSLSQVLGSERLMNILQYLESASFATNGVIAKVFNLRSSQVTKDLRVLLGAELIKKEKVGKRILYSLSKDSWQEIKMFLHLNP